MGRLANQRYFHGGVRDLNPGDEVKPQTETGHPTVSGNTGAPYSPSLVYLTTTARAARAYAEIYLAPAAFQTFRTGGRPDLSEAGGDLYEVQPVDKVTLDPDDPKPRNSWATSRAKVIKVVERRVPPKIGGGTPPWTTSQTPARKPNRPGRNDPCSCGSGLKFKKCCGA